MSVTIGYTGRFGNNFFQYAIGRIFAERLDLQLKTDWVHQDIIKLTKPNQSIEVTLPEIIITEKNIFDLFFYPIRFAHYDFSGFFQQSRFYLPYREKIKSWLVKPYKTINFKDIIIHLRADDYGKAHRIGIKWFLDILEKETFENLHIVMSPLDEEYLVLFVLAYPNVIIHSSTVKEDFELIASFNKIICSNSTFCWWAAFLGNPERVYTFKKWLPNNPQIDLTELPNGIVVDGDFLE